MTPPLPAGTSLVTAAAVAVALAAASCSTLPHRGQSASGPDASVRAGADRATDPSIRLGSDPNPAGSPLATADQTADQGAALPPVPQRWVGWKADRAWFPQHRLVGYSGYPNAPGQGRLGIGDLDGRVAEIVTLSERYAAGRTVVPTLELIAVTVHGKPGRDGTFRTRAPDSVIQRYLQAARRVGGLLLLNIQPGRSDFRTEVVALRKWLEQPDVGLALDPEWRMGPGEVPMRVFGHVSGAELDSVGAYLSELVTQRDLPPKVIVYHQLHVGIVRPPGAITSRRGVSWVKSVDGIGSPAMKVGTWRRLTAGMPSFIRPGFKLFFQEDGEFGPVMTPQQVLSLTPAVDYVLYE